MFGIKKWWVKLPTKFNWEKNNEISSKAENDKISSFLLF
tara:strand:- start:390 stop:506 length:117 start_codon:yes stop_codon:yes gene_type:complete